MRFGIVGCGEAGALRAQAVAALAGSELAAVADPDRRRREQVAGRHGAAAYADLATLLGDPRVEAVIVSTRPDFHCDHVLAALGAGRPVLCEKPLAPSVEESRRMVEEAKRRRLTFATGFNMRHFPAFARARAILDGGELGDIDFVRARHGHPGGAEFTHDWVHDSRVAGGGTLMDNGIHLLDLVQFFLGDVEEVKGYSRQSLWRFPGCEDNGFALLRSREGKIASLQSSWTEWRGYGLSIEVYAERGFVSASYPPMLLEVARARAPGERLRPRRHWFPLFQVIERLRSYRWTMVQSFVCELADFVEAAGTGRRPLSSGHSGLRAVELAHAVYRSSATGEAVHLPPLD